MNGKISLEDHWESDRFSATGNHNFTKQDYYDRIEVRLRECEKRIEDMDKNGIQTAVLSFTQPGIEGICDTKEAIKLATEMNNYVAEKFIAKYPDRFRAFAALPMQDPEAAAKELERTVKDMGFVGALINGYSNIGDENTAQYLDEPQVWGFWEQVEKLDVPVYLHPRIPLPNQQRIFKDYDGLLGSAWWGSETGTHAVRLILSGLFDKYPKLQVILGHLGEGLTFTLPRTEHRLAHQRQETHGAHKLPPMEYFQKSFYVTTSGIFRTQSLMNAMAELSSDRILFSVDYPYETMEQIASWFDTCPISENDRVKMGYQNAAKLLKI
mgnify:CR=1 FL=1